jgi:uncharacterized protein YdeI (YjbR/CyaY-like superfamily)
LAEQMMFRDRASFRRWLHESHATSRGVWLVFSKASALKTLKPGEALEEALCYGWIDGQIKSLGDDRYVKKFTPRTKDSKWSESNRALACRLIESGSMTEPGLAAVDRAKNRGHWDAPAREPVSDDQTEVLIWALQGADLALANFLKMPPSVRRTYTGLYLDAKKEETRLNRLQKIIERLNANKGPM